jgi:hypothetical protein
MIRLRQFRSGDLNALYAMSLAMGHQGGDASHLYDDARLMRHVYSAPYALLEPTGARCSAACGLIGEADGPRRAKA